MKERERNCIIMGGCMLMNTSPTAMCLAHNNNNNLFRFNFICVFHLQSLFLCLLVQILRVLEYSRCLSLQIRFILRVFQAPGEDTFNVFLQISGLITTSLPTIPDYPRIAPCNFYWIRLVCLDSN